LNRWAVAASYLWSTDSARSASSSEIDFFPQTDINKSGGVTVTAYTAGAGGSTITLSGASSYLQPGMRLVWTNSDRSVSNTTGTVLTTMTILEASVGGTSFTVDLSPSEGGHTSAITGHTAFAYLLPREDVFQFTLAYANPAVIIQDADETFLDNVSFGGGVDVEEKYLRMAAPTWLAASTPQGQFGTFTQRHGSYYRSLRMTPAGKTATVRLSNIRSRTKVKHGFGLFKNRRE